MPPSAFLAHAPADSAFAHELGAFLESGCAISCVSSDGAIRAGEDLLDAAEMGVSHDILILLLSLASNLRRWVRERWEPVLFEQAAAAGTRLAVVLLDGCDFPPLLRRRPKFVDAGADRLAAMRILKRWIWGIHFGTTPSDLLSPDLDRLYRALADSPGVATASGKDAARFAREAAHDFAAVLWIPAHRRTLAQIAGELGAQLHLRLDGRLEENCARLRDLLSAERSLVILDAPTIPVDPILAPRRSSILFTSEPVRLVDSAVTLESARALALASRLAEAYEEFYALFRGGIETAACARALIDICERWDRWEEAETLRPHCVYSPGEQMALF